MKLLEILSQINIDPNDLDIPKTDADSNTVGILLELAFGVMGGIAFLVIVIAGMQYVLSRGDADKAAKAKNTIIYAAVGLVIAVLAFTIVRYIAGSV